MAVNPYAQYQKTQVETADQGKLLLMLYEGALRFLGRSRKSLQEGDVEGANSSLVRTQEIVVELMSSLDMEAGGEMAVSLFRIYEYMHYLLVQANVRKEEEPLQQVEKMLLELRDAWREALGVGASVKSREERLRELFGGEESAAEENDAAAGEAAEEGSGAPAGPGADGAPLSGYEQGKLEEHAPRDGQGRVNASG